MIKHVLTVAVAMVLWSVNSQADDMTCASKGAVRCPCPASMLVSCPGYDGSKYIGNDQKIKSVTIRVKLKTGETKSVVIENPKDGIRSYYAAQYNEEAKEAARKAGIKEGDVDFMSLDTFVADSDITLYEDAGPSFGGGLDNVPVARRSGTSSGEKCIYESKPALVTAKGCGAQKICVGLIKCNDGMKGQVGCLAKGAAGTECPSADACVADPDVVFGEPSKVQVGGGPKSSGSSSAVPVR